MALHIRHAGRYREIAMALMRHGFGYMVEELGLHQMLAIPLRLARREVHGIRTLGERIRLVLEELGPTFVKLGQLASTRSDLLPENIIKELTKLQEQVPPFPATEARKIIELELGLPIEEVFESFEDVPVAAASIGQVHLGTLHSGEKVAIKVQRPGVSRIVNRDLEILRDLTGLIKKHMEWASQYQLEEIVEEFAKSMREELDYSVEGRNMERIASQFERDRNIHIPVTYWNYTSARVLTMEYIDGIALGKREEIIEQGLDLGNVAQHLVDSMLQQIFIDGFFHADPHPGNLLALRDGRIAFLDFGLMGRLSSEMKSHLTALIIALLRKNTDSMIRAVMRLGFVPEDVNMSALRSDFERMREQYYDVPFSRINLGSALNEMFDVVRRYRIGIPPDLTLLGKSLITLEGVIERLDPSLSILSMAEPFGRKLLRDKYAPNKVRQRITDGALHAVEMLTDLPRQASELSRMIRTGKMRIEVSVPEVKDMMQKMDQISNRLAFSIVLLAFSIIMVGLIVGSSLRDQTPILWGFPVVEIGFVIATLMVIWLFYAIFKSGRF
ncbi:AarF/ABC1/UbiB kinase family protein [Paenibacillus sp. KACC 21273]|uniref:ABC1 kinase family protein n=1 Tax=unclassified Paenibacillus TaxID=185978 RepID=UPI0023651FAA|nr:MULTISPECIES: AarF/ABC1/UbiB kinase family protein [unclassified Paenibacillus]WDF51371.1 AarF/ABC1/UbiB kinase family protein [Paenibacillus sp. KACC 21273]